MTFVTASIGISALLMHSLVVHPLCILDHVLRPLLVPLQHLGHVCATLLYLHSICIHRNILARQITVAHSHLSLLSYIFVVVEDGVSLARLNETSYTSLSLLLVIERGF